MLINLNCHPHRAAYPFSYKTVFSVALRNESRKKNFSFHQSTPFLSPFFCFPAVHESRSVLYSIRKWIVDEQIRVGGCEGKLR